MSHALINFIRNGQWADMTRAYTLHINGAEVGALKRKSTLQVPVGAGEITIEATIDWCKATPLTIALNSGDVATVEVSNTYGAMKASYAIEEGKDTYLTLTRLD